MAFTAGQISRDLFRFDFRTLVGEFRPLGAIGAGDGTLAAEDPTARALKGAGLASLFALPFLLLGSVVVDAPLAIPPAIGLGYLAVSHALAIEKRRRADIISAAVLGGLVVWLLLFLLLRQEELSHAGLMAALMAPVLAAAPAFARSFIRTGQSVEGAPGVALRNSALERVACVDELTPNEQVLVIDGGGSVLAATAAARKALRMLPDAFEHHLNSIFGGDELISLLDAVDRCTAQRSLVEASFSSDARSLVATMSPCSDGAIALRLSERPAIAPRHVAAAEPSAVKAPKKPRPAPSCDIGEAFAFALRHSGPKAAARKIILTAEIEPGIAVACDRQVGRRVACQLVDIALNGSRAGGRVNVAARKLRSVALVSAASKVGADGCEDEAESDAQLETSTLRAAVEGAGGTLVVRREGHDIALSVRLDLAAATTGE